jgi:hypothetical protein
MDNFHLITCKNQTARVGDLGLVSGQLKSKINCTGKKKQNQHRGKTGGSEEPSSGKASFKIRGKAGGSDAAKTKPQGLSTFPATQGMSRDDVFVIQVSASIFLRRIRK